MALAPSSETREPPMIAFEDDGSRPIPDDMSRLIHHEFSRAGRLLSSVLAVILNVARETRFDAASASSRLTADSGDQQPWLLKLCEWREFVGFVASTLINTINEEVGCGNQESDYYNTKQFSVYMWWRVCKMVADIEVVASPSSRVDIDHLFEYFEYTRQLFLELWIGFVMTLERDVHIIRLTNDGPKGQTREIFPESCGTFRTIQDPDVFPEVDPGNHDQLEARDNELKDNSKDHMLQALLFDTTPASALKTGAKRIYWKLRLFFNQAPISCQDFRLTARILYAHTTLRAESGKTKLPTRPYKLPRPFKKWRDMVRDAVHTPEIDRQVTHIYQTLIGRSGPLYVRGLCNSLWVLLESTPMLFRAFELLIPESCLVAWRSESHRIQTLHKSPTTKSVHPTVSRHRDQPQILQIPLHLRGGYAQVAMEFVRASHEGAGSVKDQSNKKLAKMAEQAPSPA